MRAGHRAGRTMTLNQASQEPGEHRAPARRARAERASYRRLGRRGPCHHVPFCRGERFKRR